MRFRLLYGRHGAEDILLPFASISSRQSDADTARRMTGSPTLTVPLLLFVQDASLLAAGTPARRGDRGGLFMK